MSEPLVTNNPEKQEWMPALVENPAKSYGVESGNILIQGDNLPAMQALLAYGFAGTIDCVQIDPPYNTGEVFKNYSDAKKTSLWAKEMHERLLLMHEQLVPNGFLLCHIDSSNMGELQLMLDEVFGGKDHRAAIFHMLTKHSDPSSGSVKSWLSDPVELMFAYSKAPNTKPFIGEGKQLTTFLDGADFGDRSNEGNVTFRGGKKQEAYIQFGFQNFAPEGGTVFDAYPGSGTGAAVATKMGLTWIGTCLPDHMDTHCLPRLRHVVDGTDTAGISAAVGWHGGSEFTYYEVGEIPGPPASSWTAAIIPRT